MTRHGAAAILKSLPDINLVFATYVAGYLLAFVLQVLVARGLGTSGRGAYEVTLLTISITQAVMSLGVGVASLYYVGKRTYALRDLLSNSQFIVLASTLLSGLLVLVAVPTCRLEAALRRACPTGCSSSASLSSSTSTCSSPSSRPKTASWR